MNSPTIVSASLSDEEMRKSIKNLVDYVNTSMNGLAQSFDKKIDEMNNSLKKLGTVSPSTGGGSANTSATKQDTQATEDNTAAKKKNARATKEQQQANKEAKITFDQMAQAQKASIRSSSDSFRNADTLQTMNTQLDLMRERLREARNQYSSFVALAAKATTTGDKGLFQFATEGVHRYENEVKNLIPQIRTLQSSIQQMGDVIAPQGHTIQNYVNSIGKINPELAQLNEQFKRNQSLMQSGVTVTDSAIGAASRYTEEIRKQAKAIRESEQYRKTGEYGVVLNSETGTTGWVSAKDRRSIEEQLLALYESEKGVKSQLVMLEQSENEKAQERLGTEKAITNEIDNRKKKYVSPSVNDDYSQLMRNMISRKLGIESGEVINADAQIDSIKRVSESLKQMQETYSRLTNEERNSPFGRTLIRNMQELQRQSKQLNDQMSRPLTFGDATRLPEKSLDDIAYKIRMLQSYMRGLDTSNAKSAQEFSRAAMHVNLLKEKENELMSKNSQLIRSNNELFKSNTALGRSWNYMKNRLAFYFTVGASTQFVKNLIEVRSQYEMNERALGILINSAERGTQIFNELSQMALVSPYTLIELSAAAKQLTAYDIAAKDVVNTTRRLADMAAAVGIPIERLTYALGQVKAYGYLNARDARMFANAGIPLVKNLSEYYTELEGRLVSTADIYDRIKKKQIGYEEVMSTISKMTDEGGKFFDFQAKMAETLKVQLANLTLAWNNMLNDMGEESQGVLVGGIGALKQMFLHWKDIEHILTEVVVALGAYKAYQLITTRLIGATAASLDAQVLAMKRNKAAMLEKQELTRKLTVDELRQVAAQNQVTAADYRNALSGKQLTKQKALLLVALNKNNAQLKAAVVNMGLLTTQEVANITTGKALAIVFKSIGISIRNAALAIKAFAASMWPLLVVGAIYELYHAWDSYGEHIKEVNKQAAEHAKEAFENIKQYLESESTINTRQRVVYKEGNPLTDAESQKAWDEMREKIELSSSASNTFIAKLMQINDINSRLAAGFDYLRDVQRVAGVMQTLEEDAVNISSTVLGGLFGEGLKDDLTDFINTYQKYVSLNENLRQSSVGEAYFNDQKRALEEFRSEVEKTTTSLYNIASKEGFNTNEQREFFEREISEIAQAEQMGAKETRLFRMQAEKEYYAYARAQLVSQLEYQQGAQKAATEKRIKDLDNEFGANKAMQESFFTWLTEKQDHAVKNMLRGKTQEEIKQGEWLKGANAKWVEEMARKFSKEYGVSFNDLHRLVLNANTWSINIPVFFQTIGQPLSDVQRDYEARTGKKFSSNPLIKDAKTQVDIIDTLKKKQKEVANEMETARKAGGKYWEDNKQRYKEENDALVADIHAYNALTDAEEKANKKRGKGSKKDPLLDALKQEISLVEELQSDYDKLSKSGASQADALDTIRGAYGKTIRLLNAQLGKYGLPQLDISQLITGKDPHKALEHFKQTLDTLVSKGLLTLERSKEIEAVMGKFTLSAKTYDLDMITKGLNNELGKLKDEYELAVELDADPELSSAFLNMFGIDKSALSSSIDDYMFAVQDEFRKKSQELGYSGWGIDVFKANEETWKDWGKNAGLSDEALDNFKAKFVEAQNVVKKVVQDNVKQTKDLEYKLSDAEGKIAIETTKLKKMQADREIADQKSKDAALTEEQRSFFASQKQLLDLQIQDQEEKIARLGDEVLQMLPTYKNLFNSIVEHSDYATRQIAKKWRKALENAVQNPNGTYTITDPNDKSKTTTISKKQYGTEVGKADKELRKGMSSFKQINEAFKKGDDNTVDWAKGIELLGGEIGKVGGIVSSIGDFAEKMGFSRETVETINDVANSLNGVSNMAQGISQIASGDYIGGAMSVLSGVMTVVSTWMDNADNKIDDKIKESEKTVKKLENQVNILKNSYDALSDSTSRAYGLQVQGAELAMRSNQKLQLQMYQLQMIEKRRQLQLEKSKSGKSRDEDKINDLQSEIISLQGTIDGLVREVANAISDITDDLLGISRGSWAEDFSTSIIDALKSGEDYMKVFNESFDDMVNNMIMKLVATEIVGKWFKENVLDKIDNLIEQRTKLQSDQLAATRQWGENVKVMSGSETWYSVLKNDPQYIKKFLEEQQGRAFSEEEWAATYKSITDVLGQSNWASQYGDTFKNWYLGFFSDWENDLQKNLDDATQDATYEALQGVLKDPSIRESGEMVVQLAKDTAEALGARLGGKNLSALQQGIQGITENTASAIEGYMNGVSQQVYLHSQILTEIRDAVLGFSVDVQLSIQSQMLLQLQDSYTVQKSIESILAGVLNPSGHAFSVELVS